MSPTLAPGPRPIAYPYPRVGRRAVALLRLTRRRWRQILATPVPRPVIERVGRGELCPLCGGLMLSRPTKGVVHWRGCLKGHALDGVLR